MDVDDAVRKLGHEIAAQDLHVASEHNQLDVFAFEQFDLGLFLRVLGLFGDGEMAKLDAKLAENCTTL